MSLAPPKPPTAARLERVALCPGSWRLEAYIPEGEESPAMKTGSRVHAALAGERIFDLSDEEKGLVQECVRLRGQILDRLVPPDEVQKHRVVPEQWMRFRAGQWTINLKADVVIKGPSALVAIDYKTGHFPVEEPQENWQVIAAALALKDETPQFANNGVHVAIIQPQVSPPLLLAWFSEDELEEKRIELAAIVDRAMTADAPLVPSERACQYCKAKAVCPALAKALVPLEGFVPIQALSGQELALLKEKALVAEELIGVIDSEIRGRLNHGIEVPGWCLFPARKTVHINDPVTIWGRVKAYGVPVEDFMSAVMLSRPKLEAVVKAYSRTKGRSLEGVMEALIDGCHEITFSRPAMGRSQAKPRAHQRNPEDEQHE